MKINTRFSVQDKGATSNKVNYDDWWANTNAGLINIDVVIDHTLLMTLRTYTDNRNGGQHQSAIEIMVYWGEQTDLVYGGKIA